jgi:hypothetical protein
MGIRSQFPYLINKGWTIFSVNWGNPQHVHIALSGANRPFGGDRFMRLGDESPSGKRLT